MEFEKLPSKKPQQTRFLRSQQDLKAKFEAKASGDGDAQGKSVCLLIGIGMLGLDGHDDLVL